jgi:hypothetical protein
MPNPRVDAGHLYVERPLLVESKGSNGHISVALKKSAVATRHLSPAEIGKPA